MDGREFLDLVILVSLEWLLRLALSPTICALKCCHRLVFTWRRVDARRLLGGKTTLHRIKLLPVLESTVMDTCLWLDFFLWPFLDIL